LFYFKFQSQFAEFEQERDEYEATIKKLRDVINRKENLMSDNEDSAVLKVSYLSPFVFVF
jgi:hypothetical protein